MALRSKTSSSVLREAMAYIAGDLSIIPIALDGRKGPSISVLPYERDEDGEVVLSSSGQPKRTWKPYQERIATVEEVEQWFAVRNPPGIGIVGGAVSGCLECVDFDNDAERTFPAWCALVEAEAPGLIERLTIVETPKPGFHVRYRCPDIEIPGSMRLASDPQQKGKGQCLIETRGEGGYAIAPGSPAECHETKRIYRHRSGPPLTAIQNISIEEREILIGYARSFDLSGTKEEPASFPKGGPGLSPGDDFNRRGPSWEALLVPHGWVRAHGGGDVTHWRRPGKEHGTSATTGLKSKRSGRELFCVFSSNAPPFPGPSGRSGCSSHDKFGTYTLLNHDGDFAAATRALAKEGYGDQTGKVKAAAKPAERMEEEWTPPIPLLQLPVAPSFPLDVLPAVIQEYAKELAWATNAPVDFVCVPLLAILGGAIGNSRWLAITRTHRQSACLFCAVIGRPGSGKSAPLELALAPMRKNERRLYLRWETAKDIWESDDPKSRGKKPQLGRGMVDNTTLEALKRILMENPRGVLMARDELAALVTGMNQYKAGGKGSDRQDFLNFWSSTEVIVDRNNLEGVPQVVRRPFVGIVGTIQPQVIEWLRGEQKGERPPPDDGFLDRFLLSYPEELQSVGERWREISPTAEQNWQEVIDRLLSLTMRQMDDGDWVPETLRLTSEGRSEWENGTNQHAAELNGDTVPDWMRGVWAKLVPGYAGRLALILQLARWGCGEGDGERVEGEAVKHAFRLVDYFKEHGRKVYQAMGCDPRIHEARRVLGWIQRKKPVVFSRRDILRDLTSFRTPEAIQSPLKLLVEHDYLRVLPEDVSQVGRKPTQKYGVNPLGIKG